MHASQTQEGTVQPATTDKKLKRTKAGNTKEDNFMPALQAVRSELATLKEELSRRQAIDQYPTRISEPTIIPSTYRLSQLSSKGRGESCDHCHICASSDHWARGCRKKNTGGNKAGSGNRRRLHPQDRK